MIHNYLSQGGQLRSKHKMLALLQLHVSTFINQNTEARTQLQSNSDYMAILVHHPCMHSILGENKGENKSHEAGHKFLLQGVASITWD